MEKLLLLLNGIFSLSGILPDYLFKPPRQENYLKRNIFWPAILACMFVLQNYVFGVPRNSIL